MSSSHNPCNKRIILLVALDDTCCAKTATEMLVLALAHNHFRQADDHQFSSLNRIADPATRLQLLQQITLPAIAQLEQAFVQKDLDTLFANLWDQIQASDKEINLLTGLTASHPYAMQFNQRLAMAFNCQVLILGSEGFVQQHSSFVLGCMANAAQYNPTGLLICKNESAQDDADQIVSELLQDIICYYQLHADGKTSIDASNLSQLLAWLVEHPITNYRFTPAMLRSYLLNSVKAAPQRILLPESEDLRVVTAALKAQQQGIAQVVLFGRRDEVAQRFQELANPSRAKLAIYLDSITFIDPDAVRNDYVEDFYQLRKHKGADLAAARAAVQDDATLAMLMLKRGEVDGVVSGACHTTANTLAPAFRLIKTTPGEQLVSSLFFVCLPHQVLAFADCAVNIDPTPEELATIAQQSARTAAAFGLPPKVALLSYSTLGSGKGADGQRVAQAVELLHQQQPELLVDGPLQYDAALVPQVASIKASHSPVAGQATVLVFPRLEAGNIGYKIAQRSANIVCIGPIIQGIAKPVNDLSRGCTVEDIIFTIAVTAMQALQQKVTS